MPKQPITHQQSVNDLYTNMTNSVSKGKKPRKASMTRQASAQSLGRKRATPLLDLGLPKIEQISYMHLKA